MAWALQYLEAEVCCQERMCQQSRPESGQALCSTVCTTLVEKARTGWHTMHLAECKNWSEGGREGGEWKC